MDHSKHVRLTARELTSEILEDATIYGPGDRKIGSVAHLHGSGPSAQIVIDVGGLIGIGAIVLNGAKIGRGSVIAAGALVPEGMEIPPFSLAMGVPAKVRRSVSPEEQERFRVNAQHYVELREKYLNESAS